MDEHAPLIGNARALAAVQRALASGSPPHAWLFAGPAGVGKAGARRAGSRRRVNCEARREPRPVRTMRRMRPMRRRIAARHPCPDRRDHRVYRIDSRPSTACQHKDISVDQVREVEQAVALAPFEGRTRVAIIDPADAMSIGAQNAFLKTLEEPPPNAAFVLIATQEDELLPTVRSRCRKIEFALVPRAISRRRCASAAPTKSRRACCRAWPKAARDARWSWRRTQSASTSGGRLLEEASELAGDADGRPDGPDRTHGAAVPRKPRGSLRPPRAPGSAGGGTSCWCSPGAEEASPTSTFSNALREDAGATSRTRCHRVRAGARGVPASGWRRTCRRASRWTR